MKSATRAAFALLICICVWLLIPGGGKGRSDLTEPSAYSPIIKAYAALERSGFQKCDEALIGDYVLSAYRFETLFEPPEMKVLYCFYDINQDDTMELLIGLRRIFTNEAYFLATQDKPDSPSGQQNNA
jgi:hypothetical protein